MDYSGELDLTYDVKIYDPDAKKTIVRIGPGSSAVARFVGIAEAGIPEAEKIEELWGNNYLVTFRGDGLIAFLKKSGLFSVLGRSGRIFFSVIRFLFPV